jgi:hypothetical protein
MQTTARDDPEPPPSGCGQSLLVQQYFEASTRQTEGLVKLFQEKPGSQDTFSSKTIERGYDNDDILAIVEAVRKGRREQRGPARSRLGRGWHGATHQSEGQLRNYETTRLRNGQTHRDQAGVGAPGVHVWHHDGQDPGQDRAGQLPRRGDTSFRRRAWPRVGSRTSRWAPRMPGFSPVKTSNGCTSRASRRESSQRRLSVSTARVMRVGLRGCARCWRIRRLGCVRIISDARPRGFSVLQRTHSRAIRRRRNDRKDGAIQVRGSVFNLRRKVYRS